MLRTFLLAGWTLEMETANIRTSLKIIAGEGVRFLFVDVLGGLGLCNQSLLSQVLF